MGDSGPLSNKFQYIELEADSAQAQYSTDNNVTSLNWPTFYFSKQDFLPAGFKVLYGEIPFVFDTLVAPYNYFYVDAVKVTITPGNYTATSLANHLQSLLGGGWSVTWSADNFKFTFTGPAPYEFTFDENSAKSFLGFTNGTFASSGNVLTSTVCAAPSGPTYLYLCSKFLGPKVRHSTGDQSEGENQLCKIPITVNRGSVIFYRDQAQGLFFDLLTNQKIVSFDLYLTLGDKETLVDLKGLNFSFKLGFLAYRDAGVPVGATPTQRAGRQFFLP